MGKTLSDLIKSSLLPKNESEILLSFVIGKDRSFLNAFPEFELKNLEVKKYEQFVKRRLRAEPIPYLLGFKEFFGLKFFVNKNVLIPRPETENLVEQILKKTKKRKLIVADVGTGSGCIAVSLATQNLNLKIVASDISERALEIARKNAKLNKVSGRIKFIKSNLLENFNENIDIIAANLPYIPFSSYQELPKEIKNFEPRIALNSGSDPMFYYKKLFKQAKNKLNKNGFIFYEIDGDIIQLSADDLEEMVLE